MVLDGGDILLYDDIVCKYEYLYNLLQQIMQILMYK